jgi:drug/metabolite transporter (DMT)-like permease
MIHTDTSPDVEGEDEVAFAFDHDDRSLLASLDPYYDGPAGSSGNAGRGAHSAANRTKSQKLISYALLCLALLSVSSAGVVFRLIDDVPPLLRAAWRMQCTSSMLLPLLAYSSVRYCWARRGPAAKADRTYATQLRDLTAMAEDDIFAEPMPESSATTGGASSSSSAKKGLQAPSLGLLIGLTVLSGVTLGAHFGTWLWSLDHTSLAASLLFVTAHPVMLSTYSMVSEKYFDWRETLGCFVAMAGLAVTCLDGFMDPNSSVTFAGNMVAFVGAFLMAVYLTIGSLVRPHIPSLYFYVWPINCIAAIVLFTASAAFENPCAFGSCAVEWLGSSKQILAVVYLGFVPGILGHTMINYLLKHVEPLKVSVTLLFEPVIGSIMGWAVGVSDVPGLFTLIGTPVVLAGFILVQVQLQKRETS